MKIITGTPIIGVIAFIGINPEAGSTLIKLQSIVIIAPRRIVVGISLKWSDVPNNNLEI